MLLCDCVHSSALHLSCFLSSNSMVIMLSFPLKNKCYFPPYALQENANTDLSARCPLWTKGYLCVEYPKRHLCGLSSIFKSGSPAAMVKIMPRGGKDEKEINFWSVHSSFRGASNAVVALFTFCVVTCCRKVSALL